MSRIGRLPVKLPSGVSVAVKSDSIEIKGPKGAAAVAIPRDVKVRQEGDELHVAREGNARQVRALHGLTRKSIYNTVTGVSAGFTRKLTLVGVGYRAQAQGDKLNLSLGFSHPIVHAMPAGIKVETPSQTEIVIKGADKQKVGQVAAEVRGYKPPEPYKGKGVRYADETVVLKETKKK